MSVPEIGPAALRAEIDGAYPPRLLDVREADELEVSRLPDVVHVPLGELAARISELDRDADWVVICRVGGRSGQAVQFLLAQGFRHVRNLVGGMNGYAQAVDPSLPIY